jgi:hypothetical protein
MFIKIKKNEKLFYYADKIKVYYKEIKVEVEQLQRQMKEKFIRNLFGTVF